MAKPPKEIFNACGNLELLQYIAEAKGVDAADKSKKALVTELTNVVKSNGLHILLKSLLVKTLKQLAEKLDWGEKKAPTQKVTLAKKVFEAMESKPKKFLEEQPASLLKQLFKELDIALPDNKKDYADKLLDEAQSMGVENLLSTLNPAKLFEFAEACGLKVESHSVDILIDSVLGLEDYKAPKKDKKNDEPSKKKPAIDKNISKVDLNSHYLRTDLAKYLDDHDLLNTGVKSALASRVYAHLQGEDVPKKKEKGVRGRKKGAKSKSDDESEKSEKKGKPKSPEKRKAEEKTEKDKKEKAKSDKSEESDKEQAKKKTKKWMLFHQ